MGITSWRLKIRETLNRFRNFQPPADEAPAVKSFKEEQIAEAAYDSHDRGNRSVELRRITGSVGRYKDFDSQFRLKQRATSERLEWIKKAMRQGRNLGPVKLYQIKDDFFVLDGNHRIAAAKALGQDEILAHIVELVPTDNSLQNLLYRERAEFADRTRLPVEINLTEISQYAHLLDQITEHQNFYNSKPQKKFPLRMRLWTGTKPFIVPFATLLKTGVWGNPFPIGPLPICTPISPCTSGRKAAGDATASGLTN